MWFAAHTAVPKQKGKRCPISFIVWQGGASALELVWTESRVRQREFFGIYNRCLIRNHLFRNHPQSGLSGCASHWILFIATFINFNLPKWGLSLQPPHYDYRKLVPKFRRLEDVTNQELVQPHNIDISLFTVAGLKASPDATGKVEYIGYALNRWW